MESRTTPHKQLTIAVASDLTPGSESCIMAALRDAAQKDAHLHVIHVMSVPPSTAATFAGAPVVPFEPDDGLHLLRDQVERLAAICGATPQITCHVSVGNPGKRVVEIATELGVHLIYTGTHGRTGIARIILGSVAEKIVRHAPCSVVVIKPDEHLGTEMLATEQEDDVPEIEPPCSDCLATREASSGQELFCEVHQQNLRERHRYHHVPRNVRTNENMPLLFPS